LVVSGVLAMGGGCTFVLDSSTSQCAVDADCIGRGGAFGTTHCSAAHLCVSSCSHNSECNANGAPPSVCNTVNGPGVCVALQSAQCPQILAQDGDLTNDGTVWIGAIGPITGTNAATGAKNMRGVELARRDIRTAGSNGLPPLLAGQPSRPFAMVVCDETADVVAAANHLANEVSVQAIVGPAFSGDLLTAATQVTIPAYVWEISGSATSAQITRLNPMVWSTAASDTEQVKAIAATVSYLEKQLLTGSRTTPLKLAAITKNDAYGMGLASSIASTVSFNGKAAEAQTDQYLPLSYDQTATGADNAVVPKVVGFEPDVIILVGTAEATASVYLPIEQSWHAAAPKPHWVFTDGMVATNLLDAVADTADPTRLSRALGTAYGDPTRAQYVALQNEYRMAFPDDSSGLDPATAGFYDATYAVFYSYAAIQATAAAGDVLASAFATEVVVAGGTDIDVGASQQVNALNLLSQGKPIALRGASGPLTFASGDHTSTGNFDVWCVQPDPANPGHGREKSSGAVFVAGGSMMLTGTAVCP
jgi:ABC-type branched-subunit amino acid transport system substrate-binding protein